jgi:hypothetical protein
MSVGAPGSCFTMLTDRDLLRCAQLMIDRHGSEAYGRALWRARELAELGEHAAHGTWLLIAEATARLQAQAAPEDSDR